jgi:glycosyltransferase involved in cell wall biosynthesis
MLRILVVCSGNSVDSTKNFNFENTKVFVDEQIKALREYHHVDFTVFLIKGKGLYGYLKNYKSFIQVIEENRYDLVHAHFGLSGMFANLQRKVPVITTFHGSDVNLKSNLIISSIANILSIQSIFVSKKLKEKVLLSSIKRKMHVIPCGVDLNLFFEIDKKIARDYFHFINQKKYILFSSSFDNKVKNVPLAKKSILLLNDPSIELIELKGYTRKEVNIMLNAVDMVLLTSFSEGSPQFIKEAMSCNVPIVSTDVGDVREIIGNTDGCFLTDFNPVNISQSIKSALSFSESVGRTNGHLRIKELQMDNKSVSDLIFQIYTQSRIH